MAMVFFILTRRWTQNSITIPATTSRIGTEGSVSASANGLGCGVGAEQLATMSMDFFILTWQWTKKKYYRSRDNKLIWNGSVSANHLVCGGGAVQLAMMAKIFFILTRRWTQNSITVPATTSRIGTEGSVSASANGLGCGVGAEQLATMSNLSCCINPFFLVESAHQFYSSLFLLG
jgi:hypothetical protein